MTELITSPSNPLIKQARALRQKKARDESGLFLVEGISHVGQAFEAGWQIDSVLFTPQRLRSAYALSLLDQMSARGVRCISVSEAVFEGVAEKENPQGIAALVRQKSLSLDKAPAPGPLSVALVAAQDPGNVGTILRTLDAVGGGALYLLDGGVDPFHPSVVRASMGTMFHIPLFQAAFDEFLAWGYQQNCRLIATSAHASMDYRRCALDERPAVLVLGSEQKGLSQEQLAACPERLSLPMRGKVSSLNVGVAAGVLLYHLLA